MPTTTTTTTVELPSPLDEPQRDALEAAADALYEDSLGLEDLRFALEGAAHGTDPELARARQAVSDALFEVEKLVADGGALHVGYCSGALVGRDFDADALLVSCQQFAAAAKALEEATIAADKLLSTRGIGRRGDN